MEREVSMASASSCSFAGWYQSAISISVQEMQPFCDSQPLDSLPVYYNVGFIASSQQEWRESYI